MTTLATAAGTSTLAQFARHHERLLVLTGAGCSTASGIPGYRDQHGAWSGRAPVQYREFVESDHARRRYWSRSLLGWQRVASAAPNAAHRALAALERSGRVRALVTQNVDGLHERAGTANVVRFHGSLWELSCWRGCAESPARWRDETVPFPSLPPRCPRCDGIARPGVVWFGEPIDPVVLDESLAALDCDVCVVVGTSAVVYPAASLADEARRRGAFTVEINPEPTDATPRFDLAIAGKAEEVLDGIERLLT